MPDSIPRDDGAMLPLPLAQLVRRAHNAKTPLERHLAAFYLWEAGLKLLSSVAVVTYARHPDPDPQLAERLQNLARPSLGHWWEFLRRLTPILADRGDTGFAKVRELVLGRARDDFPRAAGLDAALQEALGGTPGSKATVRLTELLDRLVRYRNQEIGHGAAGQRRGDFYERMGAALLAAGEEAFHKLDPLAGRRLIHVGEVRQTGGRWLVQRFELAGDVGRRIESLELSLADSSSLPQAERVYLELMGDSTTALHPLVLYDPDQDELFFLNARRGKQRTEYLCYASGRTIDRADLAADRCGLLGELLGMAVGDEQAGAWAARSQAEEGPASEPEVTEGRRALGEYELLSELGRGGMGVVYRAWQPSLGRQVAVKSLLRGGDAKAEARFRREIRALGRVEHPNLVKIFTSGADGDQWFYVMELVEGTPLSAVCDQLTARGSSVADVDLKTWETAVSTACEEQRRQEKRLSDAGDDAATHVAPAPAPVADAPGSPRAGRNYVRTICELMIQAAEAAHALHEAGVIHRDIKPGNIMLTADGGQAVLMDLGLAQLADDVEGRLTRTRQFVGTLRYASPQQVLAVGQLDRRTDVYSLGATLWELLTLRPLFDATDEMPTPQLMEKIQREEPARLRSRHPGISRDLDAIVLKCLEKDPARRYPTAAELSRDLRRYLDGEPVRARPVSGFERGLKWMRRRPAIAGLMGAIAATIVLALVASWGLTAWALREAERAGKALHDMNAAQRDRVVAQVEQLGVAAPEAVPGILAALTQEADAVRPQIRLHWSETGRERRQRMRAGLALVDESEEARKALAKWMIEVDDPRETLLVREVLGPHGRSLAAGLWRTAGNGNAPADVRFRALVGLAGLDAESGDWHTYAEFIARQLVQANPLHLGVWVGALRPVRAQLLESLAAIYRGPPVEGQRVVAANVLADYAADNPALLADLLMDADEKQFAVLYPKLREQSKHALPLLTGEIERKLPVELPSSDERREQLAKRQASAAVASLRLGQPAKVWPLLKHSPDPRVRSYLIHRLSPLGADPHAIITRLDEEPDLTIRRALLQSLGEFSEQDLPLATRQAVVPKLQAIYRTEADPGLHASAEWLLRTWKQESWLKQVNDEWAAATRKSGEPGASAPGGKPSTSDTKPSVPADKPTGADAPGSPTWYVNGQGQTMIVIPGPVEFLMGSPTTEADRFGYETLHKKRIGRPFALAATPVTKEQFLRFRSTFSHTEFRRYPRPTCPIGGVTWYEAAAYCNWLSEQEGIPKDQWCYEIDGDEVKLRKDYLSLTGYRLPTEAEMEYATRAGARTARYFGETEGLLGSYAWYSKNSLGKTWPVATRKPNDLGLFDAQGNVFTWCQEAYNSYPEGGEASDDAEDDLVVVSTRSRVMRGGSFYYLASNVRSAFRNDVVPTNRNNYIGLRPSRTFR